jgi:hypothetical protein
MHFHLPRRHRRKLLFPTGLLALAGLLWLGCFQLDALQEKLTRRTIVDLNMPPKPASDTIYRAAYHNGMRTIPFLYSQLYELYRWQDIQLNGDAANDSVSVLTISKSIKTMRADTIPNCGIRVNLTPNVRYKTFIRLIDLMQLNSQKKYLFNMYHSPFALYVLVDDYTDIHTPQVPPAPIFLCGTNSSVISIPLPPTEVDRWELLLRTTEWRWPLWLLVVMTILASWRIIRAWRTA